MYYNLPKVLKSILLLSGFLYAAWNVNTFLFVLNVLFNVFTVIHNLLIDLYKYNIILFYSLK